MRSNDPYTSGQGSNTGGISSGVNAELPTDRTSDRDVEGESPAAIRREIAETRDEMSETVDAIQEKLAPDALVEQAKAAMSEVTERAVEEAKERAQEAIREVTEMAKETVREATVGKAENMIGSATSSARDTGESILDTIRANPIPAAIAAVSLGWLFNKRSRRGYYDQHNFTREYGYDGNRGITQAAGDMAGKVTDKVGETASQAGETIGEVASKAGQTVSGAGDMLGDVAGSAGRTSKDVGSSIMDTITGNPVPAAVTGIGLAWLWMNRPRADQFGYRAQRGYGGVSYQSSGDGPSGRIGHMAGEAQDKVGRMTSQTQATVGEMVGQAQETAGDLAGDAQHSVQRMQSGVEGMLQDNPLMVGAVAVVAGAALGMALPSTPQENRLLGETRETFMETARETVQEVSEKVKTVAEETQSAAQKAASEQNLTA
jgi:hypothetical protein